MSVIDCDAAATLSDSREKVFLGMTPSESGACFPNNTWDNISGGLWKNAEPIVILDRV